MASTSAGLATLSAKVATLENALSVTPQSNGFAIVALNAVKKDQNIKILEELEKAKEAYLKGIEVSNIDISTPDAIRKNLFKLIKYSVKFIEINGKQLASTLLTEISSKFKLINCLSLLLEIMGTLYPDNELIEYINDFVADQNEHLYDDSISTKSFVSTGTLKKSKSKKLFCK